MTWAVAMLCAGLGTRLRPLTTLVPKPLVPVGDRPLVEHAVSLLHAAGARDFSFNAFYLPEQVERYVHALSRSDATFECAVEVELLGTAGGVRGLYRGHDHLVVWNGDIYAPDLELAAMLSCGRQEWPVLVVAPTATGVGTVGLDSVGRVARLRRETFGVECRAADYIGIGVFPRAFVTALPRRGCLVGDGLLPWLAQGKPVTTILHGGHWSDGGTVPQYLAQNHHWLARRDVAGCERASAGLEDAPVGALVLLDSYLGVGAHSEPGVRIVESVVGHGSQLVGRGELRRCVVWPGAVATAPLADAVVMFDGTVVHGSAVAPEVEGGK